MKERRRRNELRKEGRQEGKKMEVNHEGRKMTEGKKDGRKSRKKLPSFLL